MCMPDKRVVRDEHVAGSYIVAILPPDGLDQMRIYAGERGNSVCLAY